MIVGLQDYHQPEQTFQGWATCQRSFVQLDTIPKLGVYFS